jgi:hypothetical protein
MDLGRIMRDRRRDLQKLERKRAKMQGKLDRLERKIAVLSGSGGVGKRGGRGSRPRNETSLSEAIAQVLTNSGAAMNVGAIAEKVQAGGYRSGSANFRSIVNQRLITEKQFKSAGRGMYKLDDAAAAEAPKTRRKRTVQRKK